MADTEALYEKGQQQELVFVDDHHDVHWCGCCIEVARRVTRMVLPGTGIYQFWFGDIFFFIKSKRNFERRSVISWAFRTFLWET